MIKKIDAKRFIIYTRCSTDEQAQGDFTTLDVQAHHCKNMLDALGYEASRTIKDDGYSGKDLNRPGIQSVLKEITPGNPNKSFDGIIFFKLDRLTRNPRDLYALIDLFKENSIDFISVRENLDSSSAIGRVVIGIIGLLSAFERELTGERVKASALARIRQGKWMGSKIAYGYKRIADGAPLPNGRQPHKIVIDKPLAKELRSIWEMAAGNKSLMIIAKELEKLGIKSPEGNGWRKQSLLNILRNPFYKGYMRWNNETHKGNHAALIDTDLWDRANKMLTSKLPKHRFAAKPKTYIYLMEGLIRCGKCGSRFISTHSLKKPNNKFYYYVCGRTKQGLGCDNKPLPAQTFDQAIIDYFKRSSSDQKMLLQAIYQSIKETKERLSHTNKNLHRSGKRLSELKDEAGKLLNLATKGVISKGITYKSQMEKIEQEILSLEAQIAKLNAQKNVAASAIESSSFIQKNINLAVKNLAIMPPETQKSLIQSLIKEIVIFDDRLEMNLFASAKPYMQQTLSGDKPSKQKRLTPKNEALTTNPKGLRIRKDKLPERNSERTKLKVVSEVIAYYYRWNNKRKALVKGLKPIFLPRNQIVSKKEMRHYQHVQSYKNPIEKALEFQRIMQDESLNQNQLAKKLGISRVRVCQLLNLLKLPEDQQKYILEYGKKEMITERKLRHQFAFK